MINEIYEISPQILDYYFISIIFMNDNFLDETDWLLLEQLQRDASLSNQALAEQMGISPPPACAVSAASAKRS